MINQISFYFKGQLFEINPKIINKNENSDSYFLVFINN